MKKIKILFLIMLTLICTGCSNTLKENDTTRHINETTVMQENKTTTKKVTENIKQWEREVSEDLLEDAEDI